MTNEEILTNAIDKAIAGGWVDGNAAMSQLSSTPKWALGGQVPFVMAVIFNHDFAKALWGEEQEWNTAECEIDDGTGYSGYLVPLWQGMLQQMVIADDPIKYLGENI